MSAGNQREARSYMVSISSLLDLYPQLKGFPLQSDSPDIAHAKKLLVTFGLTGYLSYLAESSGTQKAALATRQEAAKMEAFTQAVLRTPEDQKMIQAYHNEMAKLYKIARPSSHAAAEPEHVVSPGPSGP